MKPKKVQAKENYWQRRYGKVWDTVLSDYEIARIS
jgi:hypothetical protein